MDRRTILKTVAALPMATLPTYAVAGDNDRAIIDMVAEYLRLTDSLDELDNISDEILSETLIAAHNAVEALGDTPADTFIGVREKVRWLRCDENRDYADFHNCPVLMSLFTDIERLV